MKAALALVVCLSLLASQQTLLAQQPANPAAAAAAASAAPAQTVPPPKPQPPAAPQQTASPAAAAAASSAAAAAPQQTAAPKPAPPPPPAAPAAQPPKPVSPPSAPATPPAAAPAAPTQTASPQSKVPIGTMNLNGVSLAEVVDALCRTLKINYLMDKKVAGTVTLNTYGDTKDLDARSLLDILLRINGFTMTQVGEFYRIVPLGDATRLPVPPTTLDHSKIPEDDQLMLNLVFLKYANVGEVGKLIEPFIGEGAKTVLYGPANLLFLLDSRRNIRRTMEIIGLFDSNTLASQRVRLFEVKNGAPSSIAKEVEDILKSISLGDKTLVRFMPVDRINTIIAIAPNPGAFEEVEKWIRKLDTEIKVTAGSIDNYVYRVKYSRAEIVAGAIMMLYGGYGGGFGGFGGFGMGMGGMGMGMGGMGYGGGGMGYGGIPGGMLGGGGGMGGYGMGMGGYPGGYGGGYGGGGYGPTGFIGYPGAGSGPTFGGYAPQLPGGVPAGGGAGTLPGVGPGGMGTGTGGDQTGLYLGGGGYPMNMRIPRIIPNPMDNTLLIQATPQEYQQIMKLLREIDIPPRQVLIDAKIYEVDLTGAFAAGVNAFLQKKGSIAGSGDNKITSRDFVAATGTGGLGMSAGMLVGQARELLAQLTATETTTRARVLSAPSVIATDSINASINVGLEVPTLTAQTVAPIQSGGNSLFANTISNRNTGVTLNILARVNPSGIVTLQINQEVSAPQPPASGNIQSPSFSKRSISTQVTVQDGDTIAIAGIINESNTQRSDGVPFLHRLPVIGTAFGSKSYSRERTELIIFFTPRVIYDTNQIIEASDELKSRLRKLSKVVE